MNFICYTDWKQLPASADKLFACGEQSSLFFSRRWFENIASSTLEEDQHMLLACVVDGDNVLATLPLRTHPGGGWHALNSNHTSLFTLLHTDEKLQATLDCLTEGLSRLGFKTLRLEPVAQDDASIDMLQAAMEARGIECNRFFRFINWSCQLREKSFEQYMSERPSRVRNTIARKRRKLQREHEYQIRLYTDRYLDQAVADYNTIYKASWKPGERFLDFVPSLVNTMAEVGWLRLAILYINGSPAAGQIWFVVHGKASIFRLAYDEAWKKYSPGSILTAYLMEYVIDTDKVDSIDFLTGNEHYKQDWMSESRKRWRLVFVKKQALVKKSRPLTGLLEWLKP